MNLFEKILRQFFQPSESKLRAMFQLGKIAGRQEVLKERISFSGITDVPTIDLGQQPITEVVPYVPGERLHEYNQVHKSGYRPIRLLPVPVVQNTDPFPWLPDDHSLNSRLSALHELLGCYAETEVKLKAVKVPHERNNRDEN